MEKSQFDMAILFLDQNKRISIFYFWKNKQKVLKMVYPQSGKTYTNGFTYFGKMLV